MQLLYNVVLFSAVQQSEPDIRIPPLFWISFPFVRSPQSIEQSSLCNTVGSPCFSILYIVSVVYICVNLNFPIHPTLSRFLPWCPYLCSLPLCLYFFFVLLFCLPLQLQWWDCLRVIMIIESSHDSPLDHRIRVSILL